MVTSITNVADMAQVALSDTGAATWSQAEVEGFVLEAIRDYGSHFHRIAVQTITCTNGTQVYDVNNDFIAAVLVRYPLADTPPVFLDRKTRKDPAFWESDDYYDITAKNTEGSAGSITISKDPATSDQIYLTYQAMYYDPDADIPTTNCLVPDVHVPLLILFVQWKAAVERLNNELIAPDRSINLIDDMNAAVDTARRSYERAIDRAKAAGYQSRWTEPWTGDIHDPIY